MEQEQSVYIIKPDGMAFRNQIRRMIQMAGLSIEDSFTALLPERIVQMLYPDLFRKRGELWRITLKYSCGNCEVGIVYGEEALGRLLQICGTQTNPTLCDLWTIRRIFGAPTTEIVKDRLFWLNVIHRSRNQQEVERDKQILEILRKM